MLRTVIQKHILEQTRVQEVARAWFLIFFAKNMDKMHNMAKSKQTAGLWHITALDGTVTQHKF